MISVQVKGTRIATAIVAGSVMCVACVSVPDSIKTTFAPRQGPETDNYAAGAPHSVAPPPEITQAVVSSSATDAGADAALGSTHGAIEGICVREPNETTTDGGAALASSSATSAVKNCLQDAGNQ